MNLPEPANAISPRVAWCKYLFPHLSQRSARSVQGHSLPMKPVLPAGPCPLRSDCVAKLFLGVREKFSRVADALARKLCGGSHD